MKSSSDQNELFAQQLLASDAESVDPESTRSEAERDQLLQDLLEREKAFESKLGKVALFAWAITLACIIAFSISALAVRNGTGVSVELARVISMIAGSVGLLTLIVGFLATLRWLFRSRASSLAAIERRLVALESLLKKSNL